MFVEVVDMREDISNIQKEKKDLTWMGIGCRILSF